MLCNASKLASDLFVTSQFFVLLEQLFLGFREFCNVDATRTPGPAPLGGGVIAQQVSARWSAQLLLVIAAVMLLVAAGLAHVVWPMRPADEEQPKRKQEETADEEEEVKVGKEGEMLREILTENARIKVLLTLTHLRRNFL